MIIDSTLRLELLNALREFRLMCAAVTEAAKDVSYYLKKVTL